MQIFSRFLSAHTCNTLTVGIQIVLVAWLAVGVLRLPGVYVGWVQSAVLVPNIIVLFFAGRIVEQLNAVSILRLTNILLGVTHLIFCLALMLGIVELWGLMLYCVVIGSLNAWVQNARETLLGRLSQEHSLQKNISQVTLIQFSAQAIGVGLSAMMYWFDVYFLILLQACLCFLACAFYWAPSLKQYGHSAVHSVGNPVSSDAFKTVCNVKALRSILLLVGFNGLMHLGMFLVLLPVIATELLGFKSVSYVTLQLTFILGSIVVSWRLMHGTPVAHPGQQVLFAVLYSGVIGFALSAGPTKVGLYALIFCWGLVAGGSANLCRVITQSLAPEAMRARVMSFYQTALFGMAPFGALLAGYLIHSGGTVLALRTMGAASVAVFAVTLFQKELWLLVGRKT